MQVKIETKVGTLYLVASDKGLQWMHWEKLPGQISELEGTGPEVSILKKAKTQLDEYLSGKRKTFDIPLDPRGTEFQRRVWGELKKIPYGETRSYKDIALKLKDANASRAVGTANGKNPLSIVVPCHRVITSTGMLGGYAGGLKAKSFLLNLEGSFE